MGGDAGEIPPFSWMEDIPVGDKTPFGELESSFEPDRWIRSGEELPEIVLRRRRSCFETMNIIKLLMPKR
jgi:hypothetical protein